MIFLALTAGCQSDQSVSSQEICFRNLSSTHSTIHAYVLGCWYVEFFQVWYRLDSLQTVLKVKMSVLTVTAGCHIDLSGSSQEICFRNMSSLHSTIHAYVLGCWYVEFCHVWYRLDSLQTVLKVKISVLALTYDYHIDLSSSRQEICFRNLSSIHSTIRAYVLTTILLSATAHFCHFYSLLYFLEV